MGWTGRILRVDLAKGTCVDEELNMEWAEQYLGQRGLASKYLGRGDRSEGGSSFHPTTS